METLQTKVCDCEEMRLQGRSWASGRPCASEQLPMWLQLGFSLGWEGQLEGDASSEPD